MCLIVFSYKYPSDYFLVLASNRDEFYSRATSQADYWQEDPSIWGGRDLLNNGTWLGIGKENRFAFLTNYRNLRLPPIKNPISRGHLVRDFLLGNDSPDTYKNLVLEKKDSYEGFNLVFGDQNQAFYLNNKKNLSYRLEPGIYGLSNGVLNESWPKTDRTKSAFTDLLNQNKLNDSDAFFSILSDRSFARVEELPDTGLGMERELAISAPFIEVPGYGTRSSCYVALPHQGKAILQEKVYVP
ncbi:NRDE family protein [Leptospira sp. GIMC2001]|uniref:NRDE family protein n=1 Tax=Leptospira sp. GIMC2001 TaxID=1513297 RepID=UPI00234A9898|nr:NRDE family protein [Leptospira sp. GIMC2001]WCL49849.1 NRDE family protein [Leptospira sp. GIMC2001]